MMSSAPDVRVFEDFDDALAYAAGDDIWRVTKMIR
jgi:hypothetical protein